MEREVSENSRTILQIAISIAGIIVALLAIEKGSNLIYLSRAVVYLLLLAGGLSFLSAIRTLRFLAVTQNSKLLKEPFSHIFFSILALGVSFVLATTELDIVIADTLRYMATLFD